MCGHVGWEGKWGSFWGAGNILTLDLGYVIWMEIDIYIYILSIYNPLRYMFKLYVIHCMKKKEERKGEWAYVAIVSGSAKWACVSGLEGKPWEAFVSALFHALVWPLLVRPPALLMPKEVADESHSRDGRWVSRELRGLELRRWGHG